MPIPVPSAAYLFPFHYLVLAQGKIHSLPYLICYLLYHQLPQGLGESKADDEARLCLPLTWAHSAPSLIVCAQSSLKPCSVLMCHLFISDLSPEIHAHLSVKRVQWECR